MKKNQETCSNCPLSFPDLKEMDFSIPSMDFELSEADFTIPEMDFSLPEMTDIFPDPELAKLGERVLDIAGEYQTELKTLIKNEPDIVDSCIQEPFKDRIFREVLKVYKGNQ